MRRSEKLLTGVVATAVAASLTAATVALQDDGGHPDPPQPAAADGLRPENGQVTPPSAEDQPSEEPGTPDGSPPPDDTATAAPLPPSTPRAIRIPAIGVDAPLTGYGLEDSGSLRVPPEDDPNLAAWYHGGTTPGAAGTALVNGHVDTTTGPAVFYHLGALRRGDQIEIDRADGSTALFAVEAVDVFDRDDFPDDLVYGASDEPELRLLTCGGEFSAAEGGYLGNVVAFARLVGHR